MADADPTGPRRTSQAAAFARDLDEVRGSFSRYRNQPPTKSRVCVGLAFMEALREKPEAEFDSLVGNAGVRAQGRLAPLALRRLGIPSDAVEGDLSGRKTPEARSLATAILEALVRRGFREADEAGRDELLDAGIELLASWLGQSQGPIRVTMADRTAAAIVNEVLQQAAVRGCLAAVAELLVGAKLCERLEIDLAPKWYNKLDRLVAGQARSGDYDIGDVVVEVTMIRAPDEKHLAQAQQVVAAGRKEFWLVVPSGCCTVWREAVSRTVRSNPLLIACYGICEFVGQNVSETGRLVRTSYPDSLRQVFRRHNEWVHQLAPHWEDIATIHLV